MIECIKSKIQKTFTELVRITKQKKNLQDLIPLKGCIKIDNIRDRLKKILSQEDPPPRLIKIFPIIENYGIISLKSYSRSKKWN